MISFTLIAVLVGLVLLVLASKVRKLVNPRMAHQSLSIGIDQRKERQIGSSDDSWVPEYFTDSSFEPVSPVRIGGGGSDPPRPKRPSRGIGDWLDYPSVDVGAAPEGRVGTMQQTEERLQLDGDVHVPDRVYAGQNFRLRIEINCSSTVMRRSVGPLTYQPGSQGGYTMRLELPGPVEHGDRLELQMIAAGATVSPDATLYMPLEVGRYFFDWSCSFANSETQTMTFAFHHCCRDLRTRLGSFDHTIRVVQFAGFTERQLRTIGYVVRGVGGVLTIVGGALSLLNYFGFIPLV